MKNDFNFRDSDTFQNLEGMGTWIDDKHFQLAIQMVSNRAVDKPKEEISIKVMSLVNAVLLIKTILYRS